MGLTEDWWERDVTFRDLNILRPELCEVCNRPASTLVPIVHPDDGGDPVLAINLLPVCRTCHRTRRLIRQTFCASDLIFAITNAKTPKTPARPDDATHGLWKGRVFPATPIIRKSKKPTL
jgi:hypothetical protein